MKGLMVHGTCVVLKEKAVLISGKPGSGKSSLALQLIDRGATLIADDQTLLTREAGMLMAMAPSSLQGLLEVRGVGICSFPYQEKAELVLCVEINDFPNLERLPDPIFAEHSGVEIPLLNLQKHDPLGAIKIELKLRCFPNSKIN